MTIDHALESEKRSLRSSLTFSLRKFSKPLLLLLCLNSFFALTPLSAQAATTHTGTVSHASVTSPRLSAGALAALKHQSVSNVQQAADELTGPVASVSGDFNKDGKPDLAVANYSSHFISVLLGNGDGTFAAPVNYAVAPNPLQITAADLNGDGKLDLIVTFGIPSVDILFGRGDGTFAPAVYTIGSKGGGVYGVAPGDFNGDGKLDLAVSDSDGNVNILLNKGNGTFNKAVLYPAGPYTFWVAIGDFNRDGKLDLAAINYNNTVSVLLGNGDGTFAPAVNYSVGNNPTTITTSDFNRDGKPDLVVANGNDNTVSVLLGNGDGTFAPAVNYSVGAYPAQIGVGDFNRDGKPDLAVVNTTDNTVGILLGNGDGTFQTAVNYPASSGYAFGLVSIDDFNRDGIPDLAITDAFNNQVNVLLGKGDGTFQPVN